MTDLVLPTPQQVLSRTVSVPPGAPIAPYRERFVVEIPAGQGLPLIDKKDSTEKHLQQHLVSGAKQFHLNNPDEAQEYNAVWSRVAKGQAKMCDHDKVYDQTKGCWVAFLRWADIQVKLPG